MNPIVVIFEADSPVGRYLCRFFAYQQREVVAIGRSKENWSGDGMFLDWDGHSPGPWQLALEGAQAVIHPVSVEPRATASESTGPPARTSARLIGSAISACKCPPKLWLQLGSTDWYQAANSKPHDEWTGRRGEDPISQAAVAMEETFFEAFAPRETRKVAMRVAPLFANDAALMSKALQTVATSKPGKGEPKPLTNWIHIEDFLRATDFVIRDPFLTGVINCAAPQPAEVTRLRKCFAGQAQTLRSVVETPAQRKPVLVRPCRLHDEGFGWKWASPEPAGADLSKRLGLDGLLAREPLVPSRKTVQNQARIR